MDSYIFPSIFEHSEDGGYCITFPDLPGCITEGNTLEESIRMAKEALELHLWGMEEDSDPIPAASDPESIEIEKGSFVMPIEVYMKHVRDELNNKAIKKTLTIPYWLNKRAEEKKINFSQVLKVALKETLGINSIDID